MSSLLIMNSHVFHSNKVSLGPTHLGKHGQFDKKPVNLVYIKLDSPNWNFHRGLYDIFLVYTFSKVI